MTTGLGEGPGKARFVRGMFTRIAERYDLMNGLMTFGMHHSWRRAAARETIASPEGPGLDLATGTGDLAFELCEIHRHRFIVGADFAHGMLQVADAKGRERAASPSSRPTLSSCPLSRARSRSSPRPSCCATWLT
jgi:demethylmenaquinone methyltransferase/2-methoxy-6-polyprenyl-1,4-benzoquinol methylase